MLKRCVGLLTPISTIDIRSEYNAFEDEQVAKDIDNQADFASLQTIVDEFGAAHIVVYDDSHLMSHLSARFKKSQYDATQGVHARREGPTHGLLAQR